MEDFNFYILSLTLVLALLYACFFIRRLSSGGGGTSPPSPPSLPIIGNFHQVGKLPHRSLSKLSRKHGPLMLLHFGPKPVLVVSSADVASQVLKTHDLVFSDKPVMYQLKRFFYEGNDVINLPYGDRWRKLRNIILHELLNTTRVKSFAVLREEETDAFVRKIEECSLASEPVNMSMMLGALANDFICRAAFGKKYSETKHGMMFVQFMEDASALFKFALGDSVPWLAWIEYFNGHHASIERIIKKRDVCLDAVLEDHLKTSKTSTENLMGILLGIYKGDIPGVSIDLISLKGMILDIFVGGTETTTTTLIWLMTEVMRHPTVKKKLQDEVRATMKGRQHITDDDLTKMPYLKAVIKEATRLHPSLPVITRVSRERVNLMGYEIAPKTLVLINAWAIGQDPACWEEPEKFLPERFMDSSVDFKGHDFQLIPFGTGRRICPGLGFATLAIGHAIANLMLKFDLELPNGAKPEELDVTERPGFSIGKTTPLMVVATINSNT